ncbi:MAG: hypothetical protein JO168_27980 [Solirubrobacterales bacterium]|nr:hypothetical protein [Solirubrobacterales bacterium]MBV9716810.1 hypothetical protein [Solirubrobacterales bacterium]
MTRTKALGGERMARKLQDALPGGENPLRAAVWEFIRPILPPTLVELNRDAFLPDPTPETSVDPDQHRGDSSLEDINLGAEVP